MPAGDRTGPQGYGPLTGRGMGNCVGSWCPVPRRGFGVGVGRGRGYGAGYGPGYGRRYHYPAYDEQSKVLHQEEYQMLKAMAEDLTAELEAINKRLNILEGKSSDNTGDE
ncbi:hypothetical protein GM661_03425 [Iocasia frigidifontis]|uniref:DUF5320 domain-containing protein n=1 Tax=Iocasia fonsfrigidae TaxID=2682810 RepID=A0A8A7KG06_9FIRM|nr:DUF5320 domain-containing protein [Iocasia fonsfrigidae]QTL97094.1 hypothetical protein GM661_03425 [Iocasia fonsfrigidae]